jgi:hypothetical protein
VVVVSVVVVSVVVVSVVVVPVVVVPSHVVVKVNGGQGVVVPGAPMVVVMGDVWYSTSGVVVVAVTTKVIPGMGM